MRDRIVAPTPARQAASDREDGLGYLASGDCRYRDGAEGRLLDTVASATDRSSSSDELEWAATDWPTKYSLSRSRANILRALDIPHDARVLEVGCGCGPLTRYLGERCSLVDGVEPSPTRASVAQQRTADLASVQVFVGRVDDVPAVPAYDLVVVVGVLEYVGVGGASQLPYRSFLRACADRLVEGGALVLAIENALGVKYLAGAPEDHTNRVFDSVEGYPTGGTARVFSRAELVDVIRGTGLSVVHELGAFPDYKIARVVMSSSLFETAPELAWRLPAFPSPDWVSPRPRLASEWRLWRSMVNAGLGPEMVNSFLVVAAKGRARTELWPSHQSAVAWSTDRRSRYATELRVREEADGSVIDRRPAFDERDSAAATGDGFTDRPRTWTEPVHGGTDLVELLADEPLRAGTVLHRWGQLLAGRTSVPLDLTPHNLIVGRDGTVTPIDQEWPAADVEFVRSRGAFLLAHRLASRALPGLWSGRTCGELAERFRRLGGGSGQDGWDHFVRREADLMARIVGPDTSARRAAIEAGLRDILAGPVPLSELADRQLGRREAL